MCHNSTIGHAHFIQICSNGYKKPTKNTWSKFFFYCSGLPFHICFDEKKDHFVSQESLLNNEMRDLRLNYTQTYASFGVKSSEKTQACDVLTYQEGKHLHLSQV